MNQFDAEILENRELAADCFELSFRWPPSFRAPLPGQFITAGAAANSLSYLRRAYSVASYDKEKKSASIIVFAEGEASRELAGRRAGGVLNVAGPRGFAFSSAGKVVVGSGHGTGAAVFAANRLAAGGGAPRLILGLDAVPNLDARVRLTSCRPGAEVQALEALPAAEREGALVWAAAPRPTLKLVREWTLRHGLACQVALEQTLACAVGACQGCTVEASDGAALRVCTDGPVFDSGAVAWT